MNEILGQSSNFARFRQWNCRNSDQGERSSEVCAPPSFSHAKVIALQQIPNLTMRNFVGHGIDEECVSDHDGAAIVMQQLLHFGIDFLTLGLVFFCASFDEQFIKACIFPGSIVPWCIACIGRREQ